MTSKRGATADLVTGAILFALSVAMIAGAWSMDRLEIRQIHPLTAPGLLPGLLGLALALCSLLLMLDAMKKRRTAQDGGSLRTEPAGESPRNLAVALVLCLVYALGLVGRVPFWLATAIFVTSFILLFEWSDAASRRDRIVGVAWALAIGIAAGLGIANAFSEIFLVRLP